MLMIKILMALLKKYFMNLKQYKKVCIACDKILDAASNNDEIVSFPILHVLREHPVFLKPYNFIFSKARSVESKPLNLFKKLNIITSAFFDYKIKNIPYEFDKDSRKLIIVSHIHNSNQCNNINDASFGMLHKDLLEFSNIKPIILLINHTSVSSKKLSKKFANNKIDKIVLPKSSGLFNEFKIFFRLILSVNRFTKSVETKNSIESYLIGAISRPSNLIQSLSILRIGFFIEKMVKTYNPKYIMTTYEGYSSERIIFSSARKANNEILCFGYQHSILNKYTHSLARSIGKKYNPNHIFCCGDITNNLLSNCDTLKGVATSVLGSPNQPSLNINSQPITNNKNLTFLFLPEAIESEYKIFFKFILECAEVFPNYHFIWRSHPSLDIEKLVFFKTNILLSNISISQNTFEDDLEASNIAIYRGTTAVIRAVMEGLTPIYLKTKGEIGIDIMHDLNINRILSTSELKNIFQNSNLLMDREKNLKFCIDYFKPLDFKSFIKVVNQYDS